ncbi:SIR2 family protein [Arthrobacter sp. BE255]|uniref:SIR2 family protein n=1 Tax=Arthrobacter sp. BE255 TaxID=2817721 RepID=UPI002860266F|nr:SIR2 family protein [Arthrobacter sp. BE255]MDR7159866.1 NAD-dependent SIR2 family protein deacetylase [Arthrobacter sp. BE255]
MPSPDMAELDQLLSLAFSLHTSPGSYAFVLGAGISVPSGVPSAWGVQEQLIQKVAAVENESPTDPFEWYSRRFGLEPSYESLLEKLAPTQVERQRLLRSFFEPDEEEREQALKRPTQGHRAIARLVRSGEVRIVLTLNFDRLMEAALRDEGIEPVVVSHPSDIHGLPPLHTLGALVVHLHGDYLNPTAMRNTQQELSGYELHVDQFLDRITFDYGLVLVGWSATYDPALVRALSRSPRRIYTPYWVEPRDLSELAQGLRSALGAVKVSSTADAALGNLADAVDSLKERAARHPLAVAAAVGTAKRYLSGRATAIGLHDLIKQELDRLRNQNDLLQSHTGEESPDGGYHAMVARVEEASFVPTALLATAAYWGSMSTDRWWIPEIPRFAGQARGSGLTDVLRLQMVCAGQFLYSAGVAAIASGRYELARSLICMPVPAPYEGVRLAGDALTPETVVSSSGSPAKLLFQRIEPIFVEHLATGKQQFDDSWEAFDFLRIVEMTLQRAGSQVAADRLRASNGALAAAKERMAAANASNDADEHDEASSALRSATQAADRALGQYADMIPVFRPYLRVQHAPRGMGHRSVVGGRILGQLENEGQSSPILIAGFGGGDLELLIATCQAVDLAIGRVGHEAAMASLPRGGGIVPDHFRIGDL